jgi:tetratricopeptide (TPR) repeat protein
VLLLQRVRSERQATEVAGRATTIRRQQALVPDVTTALAIARLYDEASGDPEATLKAVEAAVPLIREDDAASQATFRALREKGVMAADPRRRRHDRSLAEPVPAERRRRRLVHAAAAGHPAAAPREPDRPGAGAGAADLLSAKYASTLPAHRKADFEKFLADVYRLLGVKFLREGKIVEADDNFRQAMEFAPTDNKIKLLRALAIAGMKDVGKASRWWRRCRRTPRATTR